MNDQDPENFGVVMLEPGALGGQAKVSYAEFKSVGWAVPTFSGYRSPGTVISTCRVAHFDSATRPTRRAQRGSTHRGGQNWPATGGDDRKK
ncbi:MAG: hypothetical protein SF069_11515 [Phycisphaerae bacterium]|nr:hypothetical protein [Phycisphaerae bacterium]